jgi:hypothetical protein
MVHENIGRPARCRCPIGGGGIVCPSLLGWSAVFLPSGCPAVARCLGWLGCPAKCLSFVGSKDCKGMKNILYVCFPVVWMDYSKISDEKTEN